MSGYKLGGRCGCNVLFRLLCLLLGEGVYDELSGLCSYGDDIWLVWRPCDAVELVDVQGDVRESDIFVRLILVEFDFLLGGDGEGARVERREGDEWPGPHV